MNQIYNLTVIYVDVINNYKGLHKLNPLNTMSVEKKKDVTKWK